MISDDILFWIYILIPAFDLLVALLLWWAVRHTPSPAPRTLVERAWVATAIWLGVSVVAILGLLRISGVVVDSGLRQTLLILSILLPSVVNLLWLVRFVTIGFGSDKED